jgi:hypothetical protein
VCGHERYALADSVAVTSTNSSESRDLSQLGHSAVARKKKRELAIPAP